MYEQPRRCIAREKCIECIRSRVVNIALAFSFPPHYLHPTVLDCRVSRALLRLLVWDTLWLVGGKAVITGWWLVREILVQQCLGQSDNQVLQEDNPWGTAEDKLNEILNQIGPFWGSHYLTIWSISHLLSETKCKWWPKDIQYVMQCLVSEPISKGQLIFDN